MRCVHLIYGRWACLSILSVAAGALATVASMAAPSFGGTITFGSGGNTFDMEFKTIGNPNNAADSTGAPNPAGAVGYTYGIGKFEVSRDMINKFNASQSLQITLADMSSYGGNGANKPATGVSWNEAARFVNWLNTSQNYQAAYKFAPGSAVNDDIQLWQPGDVGYDVNNKYRNSLAKYVLPSYNEWYKAAYYNPTNSTYYDYANGSNTAPTAVESGTANNTAVYGGQVGPADVDQAGGLSPYDVMGLGGNVFEWEESSGDLANSSGSSSRGLRGGDWRGGSGNLLSSGRDVSISPSFENDVNFGFRVAMVEPVPEPSMMVIGMMFGLGGLMAKRRMKK
jgi:sulfatase modifying factor 1